MYIKKLIISNLKAISYFEMQFENPAGWHVIIGDNGSGKSSVMRAIALGLIGTDYKALPIANLFKWIRNGETKAEIDIVYTRDSNEDSYAQVGKPKAENQLGIFIQSTETKYAFVEDKYISKKKDNAKNLIWSNTTGWFSAGFGAFRRFTGGSKDREIDYQKDPRAARHLSLFGEDVALIQILSWLKELSHKELEKDQTAIETLAHLKNFINHSGLLPHHFQLDKITSDGIFFVDAVGTTIEISELSDGFRSILSLTFELIHQLIKMYGAKWVFRGFKASNFVFNVQGVILIDEVDVHLHPTWQTRIGEWFIKYFPNLQFIVATHSPLICRACHTGTIWRLSAPGSDIKSEEITGIEKDRLVYGNVLDAYGTEVFGQNVTRSQEAHEKLNRLARLNMLHTVGKISEEEKIEMYRLRQIFTTDDIYI